ncbi:F-box only protein 48 isoform X2 [Tachysurus fulvidraco]|uniref:F-box only protein 48 isoform X2 n=1 Tax=Tachysurus fulvidraco TaxID=1234273 RepID=UPI000F5173CB|nr:F-box only protein 48 isoform X2 [Tachysurus fulvidraco]
MQHVSKRNNKPHANEEGVISLMSIRTGGPELNFTEMLPTEMSVKIFSDLDIRSLCRASVTCKRWKAIIEGSDSLWRSHCLGMLAVCPRDVNGDRSDGHSWKVTLVRNYQKSCVKRRWLKGKYSNICCFEDLPPNSMCSLDVETWGEILEAELER